jgi:hypothetical protein
MIWLPLFMYRAHRDKNFRMLFPVSIFLIVRRLGSSLEPQIGTNFDYSKVSLPYTIDISSSPINGDC